MVCLSLTDEKKDTKLIKEALKVLGKENFALIIHGSSFPSESGEDIGFGTYNSAGGHKLIDYASEIFNALQLGPAGKTKASDSSPYCGTIFSGNPLFIDLKKLTEKEWNNILSKETSYFLSSCKIDSETIMETFYLPKEKVLDIGYPRNDIFFNKELCEIDFSLVYNNIRNGKKNGKENHRKK